ncbi:uncharacterized protein LOC124164323 [Ischnura elegans]|uniref:uncharacterized protein LOC124164323 n=1 Tax=Ischnura elegans TaxID=197161 RepID=UPI001ED86CA0|nr:uncharacterized protein LOC124164323 [Ischnura elegans]
MAAENRAVNPRQEEKELDESLMALGLLEPGMTLQEKRELASVVLESTRMAEEQRNQRSVEEQCESLVTTPKASGSRTPTARSESPELIAISFAKKKAVKQSSSGFSGQKRRDDSMVTQNETSVKGKSQMETDVRERRGKREREQYKEEEMIVLDEQDEVGEQKDATEGRRVVARKDEDAGQMRFSRLKKQESGAWREAGMEAQKKKEVPGAGEGKERWEETKGGKQVGKSGSPLPEKRGRKEVDLTQDSGPKVVATSNEKTPVVPKVTGTFYGPTCSSNVKELNPLRSELHGYSRKRGPPRSPQVNLLQLAKEDAPQRKKPLDEAEIEELVLDDDSSHETSRQEGPNSRERKPCTEEGEAGGRRLLAVEKLMGSKKPLQERPDGGKCIGDIMDGDNDWKTQRPGALWLQGAKDRNAFGDGPAGRREGAFRSLTLGNSGQSSHFSGAGKMKRKEQDAEVEIEEGSEVEEDVKSHGEPVTNGKTPLSDFTVEGKKKRRLLKGSSSKKWVDVVVFPNSSCTGLSDGYNKTTSETSKKILLPPTKRWRRVKRKCKSSFGSGSEVDEWLSSEEEQAPKVNTINKEQLVARFDEQLRNMREEKLKKAVSVDKYVRCKLCQKKSEYKVPPGFQEPDSDDEWNLWKICFYKPPPASSDEKLKSNSKKERQRSDATPLTFRPTVTRSQTKVTRDSRMTHSASRSPPSFEDDSSNPGNEEKVSMSSVAQSKSSLSREVVLFDKVVEARPCSTMGTQTTWEEDESTSASGSQADSVTSEPKSRHEKKVCEPVWDLLEINSDGEEVVGNSQGGSEKDKFTLKNVTVRRGQSESPEYLPLDEEDDDVCNTPRTSNSVSCPETVVRASTSLSGEPTTFPSPVILRGARREVLRAAEKRKEDSARTDNLGHGGRKVDVHISQFEENEEVQELPVSTPTKDQDIPEAIPCPICNREFPMSEIEAHASECGQEEEDPMPRALRDGGRHERGGDEAGVSCEQSDVEMRECDEEEDDEEEDDDSQFEAGCSSNGRVPRPAVLSTYVPISQQKDSFIDYDDLGFGINSGDMQAKLGRIRQSLLKRIRKKTGRRKKRRPKWRGKKFG